MKNIGVVPKDFPISSLNEKQQQQQKTTTRKPRATDFHFLDLMGRGGISSTFTLSKVENSPDIPPAKYENVG